MNIGLIKLDGKYPNIALEKIRMYYGDNARYIEPIEAGSFDKVYCSSIFRFTDKSYISDKWITGGTGFDLTTKLPKEIESMKPKINIGFTTRGCIRKCHFCFVPITEGKIREVGDIYDFWDGKSKEIMLWDNNILALPKHFKKICSQIRKENLKADFNQGLDIRLLTKETIKELQTIKHVEYKFSWDIDIEGMEDKLKLIYDNFGRCCIFVICGFEPFEKILNKFEIIKQHGHNGYCMRHESIYSEKKYITLARYVNQHHIFQKMTYEEFCLI